jgi:hypothetical protein
MQHVDPQVIPSASADCLALASAGASDLTCMALRVALCAVQIQIAWHSGVISASAAMVTLQQEMAEVLRSN